MFSKSDDWDFVGHLEAGEEVPFYYFKNGQPDIQSFSFQLGGYYWTAPLELAKLMDPKVQRPFQHTIEFKNTDGGTLKLLVDVTYENTLNYCSII